MDMSDKRLKMSIPEYMRELVDRQSTDNLDDIIMQSIINKLGYRGRVTCGFIYIEPYNQQPISIKQFAQALMNRRVI